MIGEKIEHFLLRCSRIRFGNENLARHLGVKPALFREMGAMMLVDLDPSVEVERLQTDGEEFR
jgi:hypothetical protein